MEKYGKIITIEICYSVDEHIARNQNKKKVIHNEDMVRKHYDWYKNGLFGERSRVNEIENDVSFNDSSKTLDEIVAGISEKIETLLSTT